jgi:hypothetical protein
LTLSDFGTQFCKINLEKQIQMGFSGLAEQLSHSGTASS